MSIRVLSRARAYLCPLAQVRESLGRSGVAPAGVPDLTLGAILDGTLSAFEAELGRPLLRGRYEEAVAGTGRSRLYLTCTPIASASLEVRLNGQEVADFTLGRTGELYRLGGAWPEDARRGEDGRQNVLATYTGGYVAPSLSLSWAPSLEVARGQWVRHPDCPELLLECTTAGAMASAEPAWPDEEGANLASGTAQLVSRDAQELPEQLRDLAAYSALVAYQASALPPGVVSVASEGVSLTIAREALPTAALPPVVCGALANWRGQL